MPQDGPTNSPNDNHAEEKGSGEFAFEEMDEKELEEFESRLREATADLDNSLGIPKTEAEIQEIVRRALAAGPLALDEKSSADQGPSGTNNSEKRR